MTVIAAAQQAEAGDTIDDPANWQVPAEHQAAVDAWASAGDGGLVAAVSGKPGLPIAGRDRAWDSGEAVKRLAAADALADGHFWRDPDANPDTQAAYRLPFADIIDGKLTAVPAGIIAAAGAVQGARGGVNIPDADLPGVRARISGYYERMDMTPPWKQAETAAADPTNTDSGTSTGGGFVPQVGDAVQVDSADGPLYGTVVDIDGDQVTVRTADGVDVDVPAGMLRPADSDGGCGCPASQVAAAAPVAPPDDWFTDPGLDGPTALTVTADGRVYGHLATWSSCHTGYSGQGMCVTAPRSDTGYRMFHLGEVVTASGATVPVGRLTLGTGHAGPRLGMRAAAEHYDNTGAQVAVVRAGEDEHGIWLAGSVVPEATAEQVAALRRSPLSGDWRRVAGNLELIAALAVNAPGFPIPRPRAAVDGVRQASLVAAGVVPRLYDDAGTPVDLTELVAAVLRPTLEGFMTSAGDIIGEVLERRARVAELDKQIREGGRHV